MNANFSIPACRQLSVRNICGFSENTKLISSILQRSTNLAIDLKSEWKPLPGVFGATVSYKKFTLLILSVNSILFLLTLMARNSLRFAREILMLEGIVSDRTEELLRQKEKVDDILSNMLPKETANQLKKTGRGSTRKYNMVTILFSDIEGFTRIAEQMNPEILVDELDKFFFKFDSLVGEYNIEKIKTIGDAYMAAGGIPEINRTNPIDVVMAAMKIMQFIKQLKNENEYFWDLRIGIHTGPVIAGIVGHKKFSYDIWGDSVNTASRMESSGEAGKINISGSTYEYIKEFFACEYRGKMPVKYKGNIDMYFVKGFRPEFSIDMKGEEPNEQFFIKLQLLRLRDIEDKITTNMEMVSVPNLYFHDLKYCKDLLTQCELFSNSEKLSDEERLILRTAALFDNMSYTKGYAKRDDYVYQLGKELFPKYHYNEKQASEICRLIKMPFLNPKAKSLPEKILSDARLAFLGKTNISDHVNRLFLEMKACNQISSKTELIDYLVQLLKKFNFYTLTAEKLAEVSPSEQIANLLLLKHHSIKSTMKI